MPRIILSLLLIVPAAQAQKFDFGSLLKKAIEKPENKKPASTNARNAPSQEDALGMSIVDLLRTSGSVNYQQEATMGETIAHLNYLVGDGRLRRIENKDGTIRFRRTS